MTSKSSTRSIAATYKGQQKLRNAQKDSKEEYLSYPKIAEKAGVSRSTIERFFSGKAVDVPFASWITEALGLELADVVDIRQLESSTDNSATQQPVNLTRHTFQAMLDEQRKLTSSPLINKPGKKFNHPDMYVPLGVVERVDKEPKRSQDEGFPLQGSQLYQEKEKVIPIEHNQFFEQLRKGETANSNGKQIAIIGEPGAGKTTQLQKIADWVLTETEDMVVWVSLADLQGRSLEDYLLQVWLRDALSLKPGGVTDAMEDALVERFKDGEVWLLLDGVDEMGVSNPLLEIKNQLRGWIASARVVLTCRLNVWDMGKNYLITDFDVYRNLDFSEPQRQEFIAKYFRDDPQLAEDLEKELEKPGKKRIRDLVRNPLRLTLLCSAWERHQGKLPETKAGLYESFVNTFYEWKEEHFPTTSAQRKELNKALGELAKQAIDQPSSRFRLTQHQVCEVLGEIDEPLFELATKIGWLNSVGVAEENRDEPVYAFFHPTFQEYFAALAIDDWCFFLNHVPENPDQGTYRVFDTNWKEPLLIWLTRQDIKINYKENLLIELVTFRDYCDGIYFYGYQAYILALDISFDKNTSFLRSFFNSLQSVYFHDNYIENNEMKEVSRSMTSSEAKKKPPIRLWIKSFWLFFPSVTPGDGVSFIQEITKLSLDELHSKLLNLVDSSRESDIKLKKMRWQHFFFDHYSIVEPAINTTKKELCEKIEHLKDSFTQGKNCTSEHEYCEYYWSILFHFAQNMSYPDFYKAWHNQPATTHPEATETTPVGDTLTTQTLNQQLTDLASQLQPTATTYPVVLDLGTLKGETEPSAIAQKICNLLYSANVFPETVNLPPEVNNAFQLERYFFAIKRHLNRENLILILQNQQPYPELVDFCHQLCSDTVRIAWITDQPLDPPLRGFPPQPNLTTILQNWLDELG